LPLITNETIGLLSRQDLGFGQDAAHESLTALEAAVVLADLRNPPSNRFEALGGDRKGQYSIRIKGRMWWVATCPSGRAG
jgi:proteic killer suppression protein